MKKKNGTRFDAVEKIGRSVIQHGKYNDRIYLMKFRGGDEARFMRRLHGLASRSGYSKIFAKVPEKHAGLFLRHGFEREAFVPGFYNGSVGAVFLGKYLAPARKRQSESARSVIRQVLDLACRKKPSSSARLPKGCSISLLKESDAVELAALYRTVFKTYPFPIFDPGYLISTMRGDIMYFGVKSCGRLVAAASSEMDPEAGNVEMTDFATAPDFLGKGLACLLLGRMETEMRKKKVRTFYTIARALSHGMNITFAKKGYKFAGSLINNTNIFGKLETMNVWHKPGASARKRGHGRRKPLKRG